MTNSSNYVTASLYDAHNKLTDKKILGTITREEDAELEEVRLKLESSIEKGFINFYETQIEKLQELHCQLEELKRELNNKNDFNSISENICQNQHGKDKDSNQSLLIETIEPKREDLNHRETI